MSFIFKFNKNQFIDNFAQFSFISGFPPCHSTNTLENSKGRNVGGCEIPLFWILEEKNLISDEKYRENENRFCILVLK